MIKYFILFSLLCSTALAQAPQFNYTTPGYITPTTPVGIKSAAPNGTAPFFAASTTASDINVLKLNGQAASYYLNAANHTGILPTANGGTGIAYFTAAGPTVARIYTFPDAAATIIYNGGPGGTPSSLTGTNISGTAAALNIGGNAATASVAPAGTLTGTTLAANVVTTSITSVGTLATLTVTADATINGVQIGKGLGSVANNTRIGISALGANTSGDGNFAGGSGALASNTTGIENVALGASAAKFQADGSTPLTTAGHGVYIGTNVKGFSNSDSHAIVIGDDATGTSISGIVIGTSANTSFTVYGTPKFTDGTDTTKRLTLALSGITTDTTRTWTVPDVSDTFVGLSATQTLTAKTLTTPTISGAITFPDNTRQTFNPGADAAGINVGSHAGDPGTLSNGDMWYQSTSNELRTRINGATIALGVTPTAITVADTTDATTFVSLFESATGDLAPKTDGALLYNASTGSLGIGVAPTNPFTLYQAINTDGVRISSNQSSPWAVNDIGASLLFTMRGSNNDYGGAIKLLSTGVTGAALNPRLGFFTEPTGSEVLADMVERVTILSGGNVGFGTVTPNAKVEVLSTSAGAATTPLIITNNSNTASTEVAMRWAPSNDQTSRYTEISTINDGGNGLDMLFKTGNAALPSERMRITKGGNVGIGMTPTNTLDVTGTLGTTGIATFGAPITIKGYTVATLPAGVTGHIAYVTDALTPAFGVTIVGGGAVVTPVFYDGTNWTAR